MEQWKIDSAMARHSASLNLKPVPQILHGASLATTWLTKQTIRHAEMFDTHLASMILETVRHRRPRRPWAERKRVRDRLTGRDRAGPSYVHMCRNWTCLDRGEAVSDQLQICIGASALSAMPSARPIRRQFPMCRPWLSDPPSILDSDVSQATETSWAAFRGPATRTVALPNDRLGH